MGSLASTAWGHGEPGEITLAETLNRAVGLRPLVLLGEVHDNLAQHRLRADAWNDLLRSGRRPALLMEQFDREQQPEIDRMLARKGASADHVIAAGRTTTGGWQWPAYRPFIEAAIRHRVPIVAANVSRTDTRRIIHEGLARHGFSPDVPADMAARHTRDIVQSHCGLIDAEQAARMALAQVARDQFMARLLLQHVDRGAVLLAGNGHVRRDIGVVRWLPRAVAEQSLAIGVLERGGDTSGEFDLTILTEAALRPDPCEGMRAATPT